MGSREWRKKTRRQGDKGTRRRKFLVPLSPLLLVPLSSFSTPYSRYSLEEF
jgi:hypothetical protein